MASPKVKPEDPKAKLAEEFNLTREFTGFRDEAKYDIEMRMNGVSAKRGSSGFQFAGYKTLEQFYRGDQWTSNPAPGAAQFTDNYCATIVDNLSSLLFDDSPEINCPTDDPTDELLGAKAELKEKLIWRVWEDNGYEVEFDEMSKVGSLYGDTFIKGPWAEKTDDMGNLVDPKGPGTWRFRFSHIENPATITPIYLDAARKQLHGFIHSDRISLTKATLLYGGLAKARNIKITASLNPSPFLSGLGEESKVPMVNVDEYWTKDCMAVFVNDQLLNYYYHNWGFVPLEYVKNNHSPNYAFGKSDLEDVLDPQLSHNTVNNDLANLLKWISSVNMWGKNLEGMQALVAGLSRIYSLPEDGELHSFEKTGDPYIANTYVAQRRAAVIELSGVSEAMLSSSQVANSSGRALALAFQGTIRKLNPRAKRYKHALQSLNSNILKLYEIYYPKTKLIIEGDYRNKVHLPTTLLRNIVDTINKFQSGLISQETAMREAGVSQPKLEKKLMIHDLKDPVLGPQVARQPSLLPRLSEGQNQQGDQPAPAPGNAPAASQGGAVAANNQQSSGAAPTPTA